MNRPYERAVDDVDVVNAPPFVEVDDKAVEWGMECDGGGLRFRRFGGFSSESPE